MLIFKRGKHNRVNDLLLWLVLDDLDNILRLSPPRLILFSYLQEKHFLSLFYFDFNYLVYWGLKGNILRLEDEAWCLMGVNRWVNDQEYNLIKGIWL